MAQFESGVKYVPYSQEQVFNKLSDLSNLESVRDKLADKVQGMEFDSDSLSFTVQGISITLRIIEREPYKCVKFESEKSPVPMNLWTDPGGLHGSQPRGHFRRRFARRVGDDGVVKIQHQERDAARDQILGAHVGQMRVDHAGQK